VYAHKDPDPPCLIQADERAVFSDVELGLKPIPGSLEAKREELRQDVAGWLEQMLELVDKRTPAQKQAERDIINADMDKRLRAIEGEINRGVQQTEAS